MYAEVIHRAPFNHDTIDDVAILVFLVLLAISTALYLLWPKLGRWLGL